MLDIQVLILDYFVNEVCFYIIIVIFFRLVTSTGLACLLISILPGCSIVLLDDIRINPFAIIVIVDTQFSLSKKT